MLLSKIAVNSVYTVGDHRCENGSRVFYHHFGTVYITMKTGTSLFTVVLEGSVNAHSLLSQEHHSARALVVFV
jgi:hypothetical protein